MEALSQRAAHAPPLLAWSKQLVQVRSVATVERSVHLLRIPWIGAADERVLPV
jgi:hypothetical protein